MKLILDLPLTATAGWYMGPTSTIAWWPHLEFCLKIMMSVFLCGEVYVNGFPAAYQRDAYVCGCHVLIRLVGLMSHTRI